MNENKRRLNTLAPPEPQAKPENAAAPWSAILNPAAFAEQKLGFRPDATQAAILRRSPRRCVLNCTRQWGKSTVAAAKAVHQAYHHAESLTVALSPSARQSGEFLRKAGAFLKQVGITPKGDGANEMSLLLPNGSRIVGLPGRESTIRGFSSVSLLVIDEASRVEDSLYFSVRPMLAVGDGSLWLMSTPNGPRGFFHQIWTSEDKEWERIAVPATECSRISRKFLDEERAAMGNRLFSQEYLCEFVASRSSLLTSELIDAALCEDLRPLAGLTYAR